MRPTTEAEQRRHTWATEALARMNAQTQADVQTIRDAYHAGGRKLCSETWIKLASEREWKLFESLAVKDVVLGLEML